MLRPTFCVALVATFLAPLDASAQMPIDSLAVEAARSGEARAFVYTNKVAASLYGQANGPQTSAWQGFSVRGFVFVDDWAWTVRGQRLTARDLASAAVRPDRLSRTYTGGFSETVQPLDRLDAFVLDPSGRGVEAIEPLVADSRDAAYFDVRTRPGVLLIARKNRLNAGRGPDGAPLPLWLAVASEGARAERTAAVAESGGVDGTVFAPGRLRLRGDRPVAFAVAATPEAAEALARQVLRERTTLAEARTARMQALLDASSVQTGRDERFNRAFAWIRLSMDALVMNQRGTGIFAGLPWFNNYWGRDTFISLPGALLATGAWDEARDVLLAFAARQNRDASSEDYGRIPNTVSLDDVSYNTVDGTPWFVVQSAAYFRHRRDAASLPALWDAAKIATDANLRRTDADGLLRHDDQATWMDASAGPGQEWSPRGDRALDVQALWMQQLRAAAELASLSGQRADAERYRAEAGRVREAILRRFIRPNATGATRWIDHLNADGSADDQIRPNVFFALRALDLPAAQEAEDTRAVAAATVYPWSVSSLAQADAAFHPYHESPEHYPKDAAYHNGAIWTWLTGPLVSLMAEQGAADKAYEQTQYLTHLALDRWGIGTIPENSDALPKPGQAEVRLTGTVSQAWSLAEYLRNAYEDYVGVMYVRPDFVRLTPHLPAAWGGAVRVRFRVGDGLVTALIRQGKDTGNDGEVVEATLDAGPGVTDDATVELVAAGGVKRVGVSPGRRTVVRVERVSNGAYVVTNAFVGQGAAGADVTAAGVGMDERAERPNPAWWQGFGWLAPRSLDGIRALQGPGWPLLTNAEAKTPPPPSAVLRLDAALPSGDDRGPNGAYVYPSHPQFKPGIFDATRLTIREDADRWYFDLRLRDLAQPGWNPQYGFQLTFAALLLGESGAPMAVPRESGVTLPRGYRYAVFVGGGVRVEDAAGNVLAEYRPAQADASNPLGSTTDRAVTFAVPKSVLPDLPVGTPVVLLMGGQDDHGGAGIGDFRAVLPVRGDWNGGGKPQGETSNVFDRIETRLR